VTQLWSVPAGRALKKADPMRTSRSSRRRKFAPIWKLVSEVDEIFVAANKSLFSAVRLIGRQESFDVAILLPNSLRVALEVWGVPRKVAIAAMLAAGS